MSAIRTALFALGCVANAGAAFPFAEATIDDLQRRMAAGELTAHVLTSAYLQRIAEIDQAGPMLNSVIEVNPEALDIAATLDAERRAGNVRGPLHGIPILLKDNIATADRMETTAGSLALVGAKPVRDAHIVTRLRAAGAVILGKTNLSEWANFRGSNSTSGWSGRGGQTKHPYALDRNPSGSSSGSAVAVAANLCVAAIGTETNGSIVSPASACGIVGVKPTVGLASRTGIIPIAATLDTAGPMTRTVRDAAIVLRVIAGHDRQDAAPHAWPGDFDAESIGNLKPGALRGARIGVLRGPFGFRAWLMPVLEQTIAVLQAAGAEVVDLGEYAPLRTLSSASFEVMLYEFKAGLNAYLAEFVPGARIRTLSDVIRFNEQNAERELNLFGQETLIQADGKGPLTDKAYLTALETCRRVARVEGIDAMMAEQRLDAIMAMTTGPAAMADAVFGGGGGGYGGSSTLAAVAGYPSVTLPAAALRGLPVGVSFFGRPWTEQRLLALALDFEVRTRARFEPRLLATLEAR